MDSVIRRDTAARMYPVFINWESGILESYGDHLFFVRQGRRVSFSWFDAPFYFLADVGRAATRLPIVWTGQLRRALNCAGSNNIPPRPDSTEILPAIPDRALALKSYRALHDCGITGSFESNLYAFDDSLRGTAAAKHVPVVSRFAYHRSGWQTLRFYGTAIPLSTVPINTWITLGGRIFGDNKSWGRPLISHKTRNPRTKVMIGVANGFTWLPVKAFALMFLDAVGTPAWDNMRRRTKTMFQQPYSGNPFERDGIRPPRPGAVAILFDSLEALGKAERAERNKPVRITLVGHSMGAIVANEALRTHDSLEVNSVVFMAGAVSLREFQTGTLRYLQRHPSTKFFNLTLHPLSDLRETPLFGLAPYGSLLVWLDAYLARPESELDRVMGKYMNTTEAAAIIKGDVRSRVYLKAFGFRDGTGCGVSELPYRHGDFNGPGVPYWNPRFWVPGASCPGRWHPGNDSLLSSETAQPALSRHQR